MLEDPLLQARRSAPLELSERLAQLQAHQRNLVERKAEKGGEIDGRRALTVNHVAAIALAVDK